MISVVFVDVVADPLQHHPNAQCQINWWNTFIYAPHAYSSHRFVCSRFYAFAVCVVGRCNCTEFNRDIQLVCIYSFFFFYLNTQHKKHFIRRTKISIESRSSHTSNVYNLSLGHINTNCQIVARTPIDITHKWFRLFWWCKWSVQRRRRTQVLMTEMWMQATSCRVNRMTCRNVILLNSFDRWQLNNFHCTHIITLAKFLFWIFVFKQIKFDLQRIIWIATRNSKVKHWTKWYHCGTDKSVS